MKLPKFSVLISTYINDNPQALEQALDSIINQSLVPTEIVLVIDGLIKIDTENVIANFKRTNAEIFKIVRLATNLGLGNALKIGLENCTNELVARMDSDDIAVYDRFKIQIDYFSKFPNTTILGGYIREFNNEIGDTNTVRTALLGYKIKRYGTIRCPLNHPTVMFKKSAILSVGSYQEIPCLEDYYLWLKLLKHNYNVCNIPVILLNYRFSSKTVIKRQGFKYAYNELRFFFRCYKEKIIGVPSLIFHVFVTFPIRLLPIKVLSIIYTKLLRTKK
jgi:glycosyltransferase involved in cell wall biosynthesis